MLFVILIVVLVLLLALLASALPSSSRRLFFHSTPETRMESLSNAKPIRGISSTAATAEPFETFTPDTAETLEFIPLGKITPQPMDPASFTGFFTAANGPFKPGGRVDNEDSLCFVTGQKKAVCACPQCQRRRSSHVA